MRNLLIVIGLLAYGTVQAAPTCLVEIGGRRTIDGACRVLVAPSGRTEIEGPGRQRIVIGPELGGESNAVWNGPDGDRPERLGVMDRDGPSCWRNHRGRVCAWGN